MCEKKHAMWLDICAIKKKKSKKNQNENDENNEIVFHFYEHTQFKSELCVLNE